MSDSNDLARLIAQNTTEDGVHSTAIPGVFLIRISHPTEPLHGVHEPAFCIIAQGRKKVMAGDSVYTYDRDRHLVVSVDLPIVGQVIEATPEKPYLCFRLDLDVARLGALILECGQMGQTGPAGSGLGLAPVTPELRDAVVRMVRLLANPSHIPVLAPLAEREIHFHLLQSDHKARLLQIAMADSKLPQINRAIGWIKRNFAEAFSINMLAAEARMSPSALHQHFKTVTAMSPLQYQKRLRLLEARRLILLHAMDAAMAGHSVGYDSPSQFSREYARMFGAPPLRDATQLRTNPDMVLSN